MESTKELKSVASYVESIENNTNKETKGYQEYGATNSEELSDNLEINAAGEETSGTAAMSKQLRLVKTLCMLGVYLGLGLWAGVVNTSNVDMVNLYQCTYDEFNRAASTKSIGVMAGSFIGAAISDRFRKQADLCLATACFMGGTSLIAVPWSPNLVFMGALFIINGLSHGITNVVCSSIAIAIWGEEAPTPVMALHASLSLGTAVAPIITAPFLFETDSNTTKVSSHVSCVNKSEDFSVCTGLESPSNESSTSSNVRIPYAIFGFWSIFVGIVFVVFFIKGFTYTSISKTKKKKKSLKEMLNPALCVKGDVCYGIYFLVSLLFLYMLIHGRDRSLPAFLFAIANTGMDMSKTLSALLLTTYSFLGAVSQALCAVISKWVSIKIVLFVEIVVALLLQMYLAFYGLNSSTTLWVMTCLLIIFMSPTNPTVLAWADRYIEVTGTVVAMIEIGVGLGGFTALIITGNVFQNHGSQAVLYFNFLLGILLTCVYLPLQIVSYKRGDRHNALYANMNESSIHVNATLTAASEITPNEIIANDERTLLLRD